MSTKEHKTIRLEKLVPQEYNAWVEISKATLDAHGILEVVLGTDSKPAVETPDGEALALTASQRARLEAWQYRNKKAKEAILLALPAHKVLHVSKFEDASEMWTYLASEYAKRLTDNRIAANNALYYATKDPNETMRAYVERFQKIWSTAELHRGKDNNMDPDEVGLKFIDSCGEEWDAYFTILSDFVKEITPEELFAKAIAHDERKRSRRPKEAEEGVKANRTKVNSQGHKDREKKRGRRGGKGGQKNGNKYNKYSGNSKYSDNPKNSGNSNGGSNSGKGGKPYCTNCKKAGHHRKDCWYLNDEQVDKNNDYGQERNHRAFTTRVRVLSSEIKADANTWIVDTASNAHLTPFKERLYKYRKLDEPLVVSGVGENQTLACGIGSITLTDAQGNKHTLTDVLHVPNAEEPIISVMKATKDGLQLKFDSPSEFSLQSTKTPLKLVGTTINDITYVMEGTAETRALAVSTRPSNKRQITEIESEGSESEEGPEEEENARPFGRVYQPIRKRRVTKSRNPEPISDQQVTTATPSAPSSFVEPLTPTELRKVQSIPAKLWHQRLGHASQYTLKKIPFIQSSYFTEECEACIRAKSTELPFATRERRCTEKLEVVHSDTCGPFPLSIGKNIHYITFTDEYTRYCWVYTIPNKESITVRNIFEKWKAEVERSSGQLVKTFFSDDGTEYKGAMKLYLIKNGIKHERSPPYTPQSNGIAERLNRVLNESMRAMLLHSKLPHKFWGEAVKTAAYIKNRRPSSFLNGITPYEAWHGQAPDISHLRPFGCLVYPHIAEERRPKDSKLLPRAFKGCLVGYDSTTGYKFYDLERQKMETSHNLTILEDKYPDASLFEPRPPVPLFTDTGERIVHDEIDVQAPEIQTHVTRYQPPDEPINYREAMRSPMAAAWKEAMEKELASIKENDTWELSDLPPGRKCIGTKWVFKIKRDGNGNFIKHKARLVAKGYSQLAGIDFEETFAPVARIESVRQLLAIASFLNLTIIHIDAQNAFLHGDSDLTLYIEQPEGFINKRYPNKVLRLKRSLYGLKQAPRIWHLLLVSHILDLGFEQLESDTSIFYAPRTGTILAVYVDDIMVMGKDERVCNAVYEELSKHIKMQNLGFPKTFLGLNIERNMSNGTIAINQTGYIHKMLSRFQMTNAKEASTPLPSSLTLSQAQSTDTRCDQKHYQELIGSLNHLAVFSRPDITHAVSKMAQFNTDPTNSHMAAARHILRYLKGTADRKITYGTTKNLDIFVFADANWGGDPDDRKSTSGYVCYVGGGPVSWTSRKQHTVALSTLEAEYMSMSDAGREAIARKQLHDELEIKTRTPIIYCDNQGALAIAENPTNHQRSKHIDIRYHFVRNAIKAGQINVEYIPTDQQVADVFTKALVKAKHLRCVVDLLPFYVNGLRE